MNQDAISSAALLDKRYERYAIKFVLDCGMDGYAPEGAEPTDENLKTTLDHCVRPAKAHEYPHIRRHVEAYRFGQQQRRERITELAGQISNPPEENVRDGKCYVCTHPVQAHHGLFAMGYDHGGTFGVHLHRGCAAEVRNGQQAAAH